MAVFTDIDWGRLDVGALLYGHGLVVTTPQAAAEPRAWLRQESYGIETLDLGVGLAQAIPVIGQMFRWQENFGYSLKPESRPMDSLRDGFEFAVPDDGGLVLEITGLDVAWAEDAHWTRVLLGTAQEYSRMQLLLGRRFFVMAILPRDSALIGQVIEEIRVPHVWSRRVRVPRS